MDGIMSTAEQNAHQLQQDIQNELITANQLLNLISMELQFIKKFTSPGGEFESTIKHNASLMSTLANLQQVDLEKVPPMVRKHIDMNHALEIQNETHHSTLNESDMDDSQIK